MKIDGKPVVDAKHPVVLTITAADIRKGKPNDPSCCAIDKCWGIRSIEIGEAQGHLRGVFLVVLGTFFANNPQLWDENEKRIKVDAQTLARFKSFPVNDPEIRRLCGSGTSAAYPTLYGHIVRHMNWKRHKNLYRGYDGEAIKRIGKP